MGEAVGTVVFLDETLGVVREVSGDRVKVLNDGPARYAVTCDNATSIPHAGIFRGKPSTRYLDENLAPVEYTPPPDPEIGIRVVKRGREYVVRHDGQDVAGPYSEAHARVALDEHNEVTALCVWVMQKQGKRKVWGTLDAKGRPAIEPAWDVREWHVGAAALGELGRMGLVASDGHWIVEPAHTGVSAVGGDPARFCAYVGGRALKNGKLEGGAWALHAVGRLAR